MYIVELHSPTDAPGGKKLSTLRGFEPLHPKITPEQLVLNIAGRRDNHSAIVPTFRYMILSKFKVYCYFVPVGRGECGNLLFGKESFGKNGPKTVPRWFEVPYNLIIVEPLRPYNERLFSVALIGRQEKVTISYGTKTSRISRCEIDSSTSEVKGGTRI